MTFLKQFGGKVTADLTQQYEQSENWRDGNFQNLEETSLSTSLWQIPGMIYKQLVNNKKQKPDQPIQVIPFSKKDLLAPSDKAKFIWYGHSALFIRMSGKNILIDPMLGPDTTPIAPMANKRFSNNTLGLIDVFPEIDLMLITHDHYDHLDYASIQKLKHKTKQYFVAIGVKRHLVSWIYPNYILKNLDPG